MRARRGLVAWCGRNGCCKASGGDVQDKGSVLVAVEESVEGAGVESFVGSWVRGCLAANETDDVLERVLLRQDESRERLDARLVERAVLSGWCRRGIAQCVGEVLLYRGPRGVELVPEHRLNVDNRRPRQMQGGSVGGRDDSLDGGCVRDHVYEAVQGHALEVNRCRRGPHRDGLDSRDYGLDQCPGMSRGCNPREAMVRVNQLC